MNCSKKPNVLIHPSVKVAATGGFDFPVSPVGNSKWVGSDGKPVAVYYDPASGQAGLSDAQYVLAHIDDLMNSCDFWFGVKGQGGNVVVATLPGHPQGGAYHYGCDFQSGGTWYEDQEGNAGTLGLVMAEATESYMGLQAKGWDCGGSGGEALSRVLAEVATGGANGAMAGYASGPSYDGTDWISRDQGTDRDYPSIACGVLYLWWVIKQGYTLDKIVQAGEPNGTLASNYVVLTGKPASQAFSDFQAAIAGIGGVSAIKGDNPWNAPNPAYPATGIPPPQCPTGTHWDPAQQKCVPNVPPPNTMTIAAVTKALGEVAISHNMYDRFSAMHLLQDKALALQLKKDGYQ